MDKLDLIVGIRLLPFTLVYFLLFQSLKNSKLKIKKTADVIVGITMIMFSSSLIVNHFVKYTKANEGIDINKFYSVAGYKQITPLGIASIVNSSEATNILLENEVNIKNGSVVITPIHLAGTAGSIKILNIYLKKGLDMDQAISNGVTPLISAVLGGRLQAVELLIKNGANIDATYGGGYTALMMASVLNHYEIAKMLLDSGANKEKVSNDGHSATSIAKSKNYAAMVKLLNQNIHKK